MEPLLLGGTVSRRQLSTSARELEVFVYEPGTAGPHSVVYVLDPRGTFLSTVSVVAALPQITHGSLTECVVVGVGPLLPDGVGEDHVQRVRDFTPHRPATAEPNLGEHLETGGGPAFLTALVTEVIPAVEVELRGAVTSRTLAGWSLSGLFACWAAVTRPDVFRDCLAVSPSLWFDNGALSRLVREQPPALDRSRLFLCAGEHEATSWAGSWPPLPEGQTWPVMPDMLADAHAFAAAARTAGANVEVELLTGESHGTTWWAGVCRGLVSLHGHAAGG